MFYPTGSKHGKKLFSELIDRMERKAFDDTYLELLAEYKSIYPESDRCDIFFAHYLLSKKLYKAALDSALNAESKRPMNRMIWKLLIDCYQALGKEAESLPYVGYGARFYQEPIRYPFKIEETMAFDILSLSMGVGGFEPFLDIEVSKKGDRLMFSHGMILGKYLFPSMYGHEEYRYWSGIYQENGNLHSRGFVLEAVRDNDTFSFYRGADTVTFDVMKSKVVQDCFVAANKVSAVVPIAGTKDMQKVDFNSKNVDGQVRIGKWVYSFIRLDEDTQIHSEEPIAIGAPIYMKHDKHRKKLVLNILVDGLCWRAVQDHKYEWMPNTVNFFSAGIIFNQHYAASEFTYPSLTTIETGIYPYHHNVLDDRHHNTLSKKYVTISERMKDLGYYCTNVMGAGYIYSGLLRGHDRLIMTPYTLEAYAGVERIIRQIEAFNACDQFIFAHFMDAHASFIGNFQIPLAVETRLGLKERVDGVYSKESTSVFLPHTKLYMDANYQGIRDVDRCLGYLYSYLLEHYGEDEYVIQLYSDHGATIYDEKSKLLSDHQSSSAYMLRGAGVPQQGFVEELTSTVDIYPSLGHLVGYPIQEIDGNLPAVLGGEERNYVISSSIYPGQTFKLCIRTKEHECYLEATDLVEVDGTVDLSGADMSIYRRDGSKKKVRNTAVQGEFLRIIREHTKSINNEGHFWPSMRETHPKWFRKLP